MWSECEECVSRTDTVHKERARGRGAALQKGREEGELERQWLPSEREGDTSESRMHFKQRDQNVRRHGWNRVP